MLSVDSHYLNDPLPKNIVLSPEEKARILRGGCYVERTCGFEHRFKKYGLEPAIAERLWSNDTITDLIACTLS
jgi:hexosaminidase